MGMTFVVVAADGEPDAADGKTEDGMPAPAAALDRTPVDASAVRRREEDDIV